MFHNGIILKYWSWITLNWIVDWSLHLSNALNSMPELLPRNCPISLATGLTLHVLKSVKRTRPLQSNDMTSVFRHRWTMLLSCRWDNASTTWAPIARTSFSWRGTPSATKHFRDTLGMSSDRKHDLRVGSTRVTIRSINAVMGFIACLVANYASHWTKRKK